MLERILFLFVNRVIQGFTLSVEIGGVKNDHSGWNGYFTGYQSNFVLHEELDEPLQSYFLHTLYRKCCNS